MANCIVCNKNLGMINTPMFGKGLTKDGGIICTSCHMTLAKSEYSNSAIKLKENTNEEVLEYFNTIDLNKQQKNIEKEQAKAEKKEVFNQKVEEYKSKIAHNNDRLTEIKSVITKLNPSVVNKREVSELPTILTENEVIEKINSGYLDEGKGGSSNGLLIATNYRVIFIDKSLLSFGIKMEDFPYDRISSVSVETGFLKGVIKIICSGNTAKINLLSGAKEFSEFVRQKTTIKSTVPIQQTIINEPDILGQIEKLAELKEKGILTEQEFTDKKAILLSKI